MNKNNNKMDLLGNAPVPQALMALGIPIMIGMLINALYNLVDAYFIGGLGESQMGAISIAFPLGQVVVGLGLMFGNGAASYLSRLLGRGDREAASKVASTALYSSVCIGAVIIIGTAIFLKPILTMLGATDTIMPYALSYGRIYVISCIFNVFNVTMNNIVASEGAAKTTMCALLLGAVLNIGLDPIFIYTLDMGVAGAAIATAISQMASTLVYLIYALQKKSAFTFSIKEFCPSKQIITEILKIGIPTLTFQLLTSLSIAFINREANIYGDAVIAGMGAVTRITSMGTLVVFGFLKGFQPIAGFSYGAKKFDRLMVNNILCSCGIDNSPIFHTDYFAIYRRQYRDDFCRSKIANGKWIFLLRIWILHSVFFSVSCTWKRHRRIRSWGLPTRYLLCSDHSVAPIILGHKWNTICTTDCRCNFCYCYCVYGSTSS